MSFKKSEHIQFFVWLLSLIFQHLWEIIEFPKRTRIKGTYSFSSQSFPSVDNTVLPSASVCFTFLVSSK